jgi:hypothetical protein
VFVYMQLPEVGVEQQLVGLQVDRGLSPALVAEAPFWVDKAPKCWSCNKPRLSQHVTSDTNGKCEALPLWPLASYFTKLSISSPTTAAEVRSLATTFAIYSGNGSGYLKALRFPLQIHVPPTAPSSLIILYSTICTFLK